MLGCLYERGKLNTKGSSWVSYYRYWGKAKPAGDGAPYHLLPYHCLNVAAVGWQLLSKSYWMEWLKDGTLCWPRWWQDRSHLYSDPATAGGRAWRGAVFVLPTMATSNPLYTRVGALHRRFYSADSHSSFVLAHGASKLNEGFHPGH